MGNSVRSVATSSVCETICELQSFQGDAHVYQPRPGGISIIEHLSADQAQARADRASASSRRILVVDDERDHADSLELILRHAGYTVRTAYDGLEALRRAEEFRPDTVMLDLSMPGLDGVQLAERLRAKQHDPELFLIAITGSQSHGDHCQARTAGVDAYFTKPADPEEILRLLQAISGE